MPDRPTLRIETRQLGPDIVIVQVSGIVRQGSDSGAVNTVVQDWLLRDYKKFILDLSAVNPVDDALPGVVIPCLLSVMRAGGALRVGGASQRVMDLLKITRLDAVLAVYPSVAAAAERFTVEEKPTGQSPC